MRYYFWVSTGLLLAMLLASLNNIALGKQPHEFNISIDERIRSKWDAEYPVTYVFHVSDISPHTAVLRRDGDSGSFGPLERKTSKDVFNGVECVRFEGPRNIGYVSVGFGQTNQIQLKFTDAGAVTFDQVANYYDARKAAFTLSNDNWGKRSSANPGAPWQGMTDDASDKYQASVHACRKYHLPVSVGINSRMYGGRAVWERMQEELDRGEGSWEPAVHTRKHPCSAKAYRAGGYAEEIVGCRDDILQNLRGVPYGQHVFEFILLYAMFHADRYQNSVLYDPRPGVDGVAGSTLMQLAADADPNVGVAVTYDLMEPEDDIHFRHNR